MTWSQGIWCLFGVFILFTPIIGSVSIYDYFSTLFEGQHHVRISDAFKLVYIQHIKWLCDRAVLTPTNISIKERNIRLLNMLPGEEKVHKSINNISSRNQIIDYPTEFLNSLEPTEIPPHDILPKLGALIMLLCNLNSPKLCNGTRLTIEWMMSYVLEATIIFGKYAGVNCFIPRILRKSTDLSFEFERLQFLVRLCFAMTINKSQGQSLTDPVFSHRQLYVGLSRVGNSDGLFILTPEGKTKNIVYSEALNWKYLSQQIQFW